MTAPAPATAGQIALPPEPARRLNGLEWILAAIVVAIAVGAIAALGGAAVLPLIVVLAAPVVVLAWGATMSDVLIASVFLEVIQFGGLTISRLLAPIALLVVVIALIRGNARFQPAPLLVPIAAYAMWGIASGIWTVSPSHTTRILGSLGIALTYMAAFAILVDDKRDLRRTFAVLGGASIAIGLSSIAAFVGYPVFATESLQDGRSQGGVGDPNFFANVQLVALPILLLMATQARTRGARIFFGIGTVVAVASVFATLSRGGMLALVVVALILPFIPARAYLGTPRQKTAVLIMLAVAVGVLFTLPTFRAEVVDRVQTLFAPQQVYDDDYEEGGGGSSSGSGRTELWKAAFTSIGERPLHGLGLGAFPSQSTQLLFRTPGVQLDRIATHVDGIEAHSAYIGTTVDLGFIGLAFFLSILITLFVSLLRLARRAQRRNELFIARLAIAMILSLVGWAISSAFIETETARPLWILIGLTFALEKIVRRAESDHYAAFTAALNRSWQSPGSGKTPA